MESSRTVVIVDDELHVREALVRMVRALGYDVEEFDRATDFLQTSFDDNRERCLLLDYRLPEIDGLDLIRTLQERNMPIPVIFFSGALEWRVAVSAMQYGAVTCIQKPITMEQCRKAIDDAFDMLPQIRTIQEARAHHKRFKRLSNREQAIVSRAARGLPNKAIAAELGLSIKTVEKYRRRAYATLDAKNSARMTRAVTLHGLHSLFRRKT